MRKLMRPSWRKLREWARRFGPQEATATLCAVIAAQFVRPMLMQSGFTWAKTYGIAVVMTTDIFVYYIYGLIREWRRHRNLKRSHVRSAAHATVDVIADNATAGIINMLTFRIYFLAHAPIWIGSVTWGTLLAQVLAAITFHAIVIPSYELRKRIFRD